MASQTSDRLKELAGRLERHAGFAEVVASLQPDMRRPSTESGAHRARGRGNSCPARAGNAGVLCPHGDDVDDLIDDLPLFSESPRSAFPAWETLPSEQAVCDEVSAIACVC